MGVPTSEVGYTSATTGRGEHEVHKGHVVALEKKSLFFVEMHYSKTSLDTICRLSETTNDKPEEQRSKS
jgi:hypothetical protein